MVKNIMIIVSQSSLISGGKSGIMISVHEGLWLKVHASRRRKDPRKITKYVIDHGAA